VSSPFVSSADLRAEFLAFFAARGHREVRSGNMIPDDPTLMFTNAGMVPFKDVFTGREKRDYNRATSCQKCLRVSGKHNDLDEVGRTPRHQTMFEMLGNFSFGDYFKEEAIRFSWDLLVGQWGLDTDRIWATVHHSDDEAYALWTDMIGLPKARVHRLGDKDNFWSMGDVGPCGPCSELHYDMGDKLGPAQANGPAGGGDRYMEIWNLVFMQYEQHPDGTREALAKPCVDTGMGLERICQIKQGVLSNYDTDLLRPLMEDAAAIANVKIGLDNETDTALRVLADHARAVAFLAAEGVIPANVGHGYVLRRVARRAIRFGVKLNLGDTPFFHRLTDQVVTRFGDIYPELNERRAFIDRVISGEEERFSETRDKGLALLEEALTKGGETLDGEVVFRLHDTFGFPPDLTRVIAAERGVKLDEDGYKSHMETQRAAGRAAWKGSGSAQAGTVYLQIANEHPPTEFTGYEQLDGHGVVRALVVNDAFVESLAPGSTGEVVVDQTPFYAESGGQTGDTGWLTVGQGRFKVTDTRAPVPGVVCHHGQLESGALSVGDSVEMSVDKDPRAAARRNHTATHLLHAALRQFLGDHVTQKGSLVGPNRLRFDFSHFQAVTPEELLQIENFVYSAILENQEVDTTLMGLEAAKAAGAMAFFGEKYGDEVRVVNIEDRSIELCGGTHVERTGDIGFFRILSEGGISSNVRRIEAQTGHGAMSVMREIAAAAEAAAGQLRTTVPKLAGSVERLLNENKTLKDERNSLRTQQALGNTDSLLAEARDIDGFKVLSVATEGDRDALRAMADKLRDQLQSGVVVLGAADGDKVVLLAAVTKDLAGKRVHAGKLIGKVAQMVGGRGGGRPDFAQAGGTDPSQLSHALEQVYSLVANN
jgi:alanyl-tRNA synthetase